LTCFPSLVTKAALVKVSPTASFPEALTMMASFLDPALLIVVGADADLRALRPNAGRPLPRQGLVRVTDVASMMKI
jgi:hypothetical protein